MTAQDRLALGALGKVAYVFTSLVIVAALCLVVLHFAGKL